MPKIKNPQKPVVMIDVTRSPYSGIGVYSWNLLRYLHQAVSEFIFVGLTEPQYAAYADGLCLNSITFPREPRSIREIYKLSRLIDKNADIYIATGFTQIIFPRVHVIQVVHDLIQMAHPEWNPTEEDFRISHGKYAVRVVKYALIPLFKLLLHHHDGPWRKMCSRSPLADLFVLGISYQILRAKAVVTVSNTTRKEMLRYYAPNCPVRTVYPIITANSKACEYSHRKSLLKILYIANFEPRKNHQIIFESIAMLPEELREKVCLTLVGNSAYRSYEQKFTNMLNRLGKDIKTRIYQNISEYEKEKLFEESTLLLFSSLAEGFGIPLLEAMQHGLPIVAYDLPASREVCGDGARYVSDNTAQAFAEAIEEVCRNGEDMRSAQKKQVEKFKNSSADITISNILYQVIQQTPDTRETVLQNRNTGDSIEKKIFSVFKMKN